MRTIYFQLERSKTLKDGTHPIYLILKLKENGKEKRSRFYTGRSCLAKHWLGVGKNKRISSKAPGASITNSRLDTLRMGADAIITNALNLKTNITSEYFRQRFNTEVLGKTQIVEASKDFFSHLSEFIENRKGVFQPATIKTYTTLKNSLAEFEKESGWKIDFSTLNQTFYSLYTKYMIDDRELLNNTLGKRIATLKAFLKEMKYTGVNKYDYYERFKATRDTETTVMYLTSSELAALNKLKLTPGSTEEHVRDAFVFACHTGLRFSDWDKVVPENIGIDKSETGQRVKVLHLTMHKVHRTVNIPLTSSAESILEKYAPHKLGNTIIPLYSNQETNRTLKQIAKTAKIDEYVREVKKSGARRITNDNPKSSIISCHDARNTMATIYLEKGGRPEVLQKLLGHSNIKQTMRYVKIVDKAIYTDFTRTMKTGKVLPMKKPA